MIVTDIATVTEESNTLVGLMSVLMLLRMLRIVRITQFLSIKPLQLVLEGLKEIKDEAKHSQAKPAQAWSLRLPGLKVGQVKDGRDCVAVLPR